MKRTAVWAISALLLATTSPAAAGADARGPDFTGQWKLDADRSDPGGARGGGPGGSGPGGGGGGERGGGQAGGRNREEMSEQRVRMQAAVATIDFARLGESGWTLRDGAGKEWKLEPDGTERTVSGPEGEIYLRADWATENRLLVRRVQAGRPTVEETYELAGDGKSLTVMVKITGGPRGDRELRRIYNRVVAE